VCVVGWKAKQVNIATFLLHSNIGLPFGLKTENTLILYFVWVRIKQNAYKL
jgi:hypothetical protein